MMLGPGLSVVTDNLPKSTTVNRYSVKCTYAYDRSSKNVAYRKTSSISRTLVGNKIVDNSDVVGASPVGAAPTTSSFST